MKPMRAGVLGKEIYAVGALLRAKSKHHNHLDFLAHGMGMVSHEGPRLTDHGPVPYPAEYADRPLESGMVVSVETTLMHRCAGSLNWKTRWWSATLATRSTAKVRVVGTGRGCGSPSRLFPRKRESGFIYLDPRFCGDERCRTL